MATTQPASEASSAPATVEGPLFTDDEALAASAPKSPEDFVGMFTDRGNDWLTPMIVAAQQAILRREQLPSLSSEEVAEMVAAFEAEADEEADEDAPKPNRKRILFEQARAYAEATAAATIFIERMNLLETIGKTTKGTPSPSGNALLDEYKRDLGGAIIRDVGMWLNTHGLLVHDNAQQVTIDDLKREAKDTKKAKDNADKRIKALTKQVKELTPPESDDDKDGEGDEEEAETAPESPPETAPGASTTAPATKPGNGRTPGRGGQRPRGRRK